MKDKIIFWLDSDITSFGIAKFLQEKYESEFFAIIDVTDRAKKFFEEQKLVKFEKTWYYHDNVLPKTVVDLEYLSNFEKKYHLNLWLLTLNERLFYRFNYFYKFTRNEILSILEQECKIFETVLDEVKPDFLIIKTTDLHHNQLFYQMCRSKGIKVMMLEQSRFGFKCLITQERDKIDYVTSFTDHQDTNKTFVEMQNFLKRNNLSVQLNTLTTKFTTSKWKKIKAAVNFLFVSKNTNIKTHYTYFGRTKFRVLKIALIYLIIEKYREIFINKNLKKEIDDKSKFIYFPLHQEPERVLLIASPFYTNQIETIRHIAKSLPPEYKLFVKEHPTQTIRGWREISFYKQIMKIPNVELLHPSVSSELMMKKCSLAITVGGSVGLESAFYQKPSIIFADMGYGVLPSVHRIKSITDLPDAIRTSLQKTINPNDLSRYIDIIIKNSFEFDITGFQIEYADFFYYGGHLADVEIPEEKMRFFLEEHRSILEQIALEYVKKIKQHKEH
ncbi:MAG: hypothetical protein HQ490_03090 [Lutibacter sp.]|nr:hypothetical protein [Lutibacter sp.]